MSTEEDRLRSEQLADALRASALREVCVTALYWAATVDTIAAVRTLLPDQVDAILADL